MEGKDRKNNFAPGHNACPGCGAAIGVRQIMRAAGENIIVVSPTGCLETFSSPYGGSAWEVPWVHPLFENAPAVATGIKAALKHQGNEETRVLVIGGDGATYDIGMGSLSGMLEREDEILYICYDNEGYMNTGIQRSSATPYGAKTSTTPIGVCSFGESCRKKDLLEIARAHHIKYAASGTIAYPQDLMKKVKKGLATKGPAFIHLLTPCSLGWGIEPEATIEFSKLAVETALFPLVEYENGELVNIFIPKKIKPVDEYLKKQKRYTHLFSKENAGVLAEIQEMADANSRKYGFRQ